MSYTPARGSSQGQQAGAVTVTGGRPRRFGDSEPHAVTRPVVRASTALSEPVGASLPGRMIRFDAHAEAYVQERLAEAFRRRLGEWFPWTAEPRA